MAGSGIVVRLAAADEAAAIAALLYRAFVEYEQLYVPEAFAATTPTAGQIAKRFDEGPIWIALQDGVPVGTLSAVPRGQALYIRSTAVLPAARGLGIGKSLLQQAEAFAHSRGCGLIVLSTTPFLLQAIRLYESFGFQRSPEGPLDLFGTPLLTMVKRLAHERGPQ